MGYSNGDVSLYHVPARTNDVTFTLLKSNIIPEHLGRQVNPAIIDIDNDGFFELFVGNERGGANVYKSDIAINNILLSETIETEDTDFLIYPNPGSTFVRVETKYNGMVQIFDMSGKMLQKLAKEEDTMMIDVGELSGGLYVIKIIGNNKTVSKKLFIQR